MTARTWRSGSAYPDSIKRSIVHEVYRRPGQKGKEIAACLNLDKSKVNSFLFHEGQATYGLRQINYEWFPPAATASTPPPPPPPSPSPPAKTVTPPTLQQMSLCSVLSGMTISQATIKIRSLSLTSVDRAFAEEDYSLLDDQLKAELAIRRAELLAAEPPKKHTPPVSTWRILAVIAIAFVLGAVVANNQQKPGTPLPKPSLNPSSLRVEPGQRQLSARVPTPNPVLDRPRGNRRSR
jgi:hypothetical protein